MYLCTSFKIFTQKGVKDGKIDNFILFHLISHINSVRTTYFQGNYANITW